MFCKNCGKEVTEQSKFCPYCGKSVFELDSKEKIYYVSSKNRTVAILLTLLGFFGVAGLQRIYVGRYIWGFIYIFTFGFFFIGTMYDLIQLYYEKFKDTDGFPLYSNGSMKKNYRHRTPRKNPSIVHYAIAIICALWILGTNIFIISSTKPKVEKQNTESQTNIEDRKNGEEKVQVENESVDEDLKKIDIEINLDDVVIEGKRKFLVNVHNKAQYPFDGIVHVYAKGMGVMDGLYDVKDLQPGQTKTFIGKGNVNESTRFNTSIKGKFQKQQKDDNLNYKIVKRYGGNTMMTYFVYVTDFSDENLTAISREMNKKYSGKVHDLEVRFTKVQNNPSLDDSVAMYSIHPMNRQLNHKLVWFNNAGDVERIIATIP
ncbi:zinc ribbon domain-containing protein [Selenomonas sp. AE3005]|uniref:NINE protein n=1 Tax=Selenomonas sp. AE3005 TaxID=1485543 RepID=UPI00068EDE09|nr:zinc ribbon domain-containing protein [Selenomonas sp. AE3005]